MSFGKFHFVENIKLTAVNTVLYHCKFPYFILNSKEFPCSFVIMPGLANTF